LSDTFSSPRSSSGPGPIVLARLVLLGLFIASVTALGSALTSQYVGGLAPCVLCLYQRAVYVAVIMISGAGLGLVFSPFPRIDWARGLIALCGLVLLIGAGIAAFHVGVEQHWWVGTSSCGAGAGTAKTVEELRAQLMAAPVTRCDQVAWSLFGISMAGYNVIASLALAAFAFAGWRRMREEG